MIYPALCQWFYKLPLHPLPNAEVSAYYFCKLMLERASNMHPGRRAIPNDQGPSVASGSGGEEKHNLGNSCISLDPPA